MKEKIHYLDGLRGLAALIVVMHHYVFAFYQRYYTQEPISKTPFNLLYNGEFAVCIFFTLSGFVLSNKFFKTKDHNVLIEGASKRYFRLLLPVIVSVIAAYIILKFNLFYNLKAAAITHSFWLPKFYNFAPSFHGMLEQGFYRVFLFGEASYNTNLWTMQLEFFGSLLTFSFLALFGRLNKRYIVYIILILFFSETFYLSFLFGIMLNDLRNSKYRETFFSKNKVALFILLVVGLFFGSYPFDATNSVYSHLNFRHLKVPYMQFYHVIGGFLTVYVLLASELLQKFFSSKPMIFLGKISFSLYVFHLIVLCSFSSYLFIHLVNVFSYKISFMIMFLSSFVLLIPISYVSYKYLDLNGIKLGNKMFSYLKPNTEGKSFSLNRKAS